jgi:hypothetical protein
MPSAPAIATACVLSALLALPGCTRVYTTPPGGGPLTLNRTYLTVPGLGTQQYAPNLPPGTALGHDGVYAGGGQALNSQGARCSETMHMSGFVVHGREVRFGPFTGRIGAAGGLRMIYGQNTIVGNFVENQFQGVWDFQTPPCSYAIRLWRQS